MLSLGTGKSRTIAGIVLKLLKKKESKKKILLCAPSNNACDELCRRILDEFTNQGIPYKKGECLLPIKETEWFTSEISVNRNAGSNWMSTARRQSSLRPFSGLHGLEGISGNS